MILFAIIMLALLLWYKTIVPAIAFAQSSNINDDFVNGNFASVAESLQKSLITDPAQYLYYSNLAYLYETASKSQIAGSKMVNCTDEAMNVLDTDECFLQLTYQAYLSGIDSGDMRWESRYRAAQSATRLAVLVQSQPVALDAIRLYEESIFRVPNSHVIRLSFAKALIDFGNSEKAVEILMDSLDILGDSPASIDSKFWLGIANANIGNVSAAYEIWSEVIAIDPSYIEAYQNLALIDEANGQTDVALERYSHVISLLENDLASWSNEGVSTYDTDLEFLEESLVEAYIQRASLYLLEGRVSLRDVDVERLLELGVDTGKISHLR
jgi:tetratricopeptide (TPR) repeat protein